jgi:uncharacterized membrane protein (DUF373 family)
MRAMRKQVAAVISVVLAAIAAVVVIGMVEGADPQFSRGRSTTASVLTQEVLGALALVALLGAVIGCVRLARGGHVGRSLIPVSIGLLLAFFWWVSYIAERAS